MKTKLVRLACGLALVVAAPLAQAVPISVSNFSFENPDTPTYNYGPITGWTQSSSSGSGVFQPNAYQPVGALTPVVGAGFIAGVFGTQTAYINSGSITQTLASTLNTGTYTLTVSVGDRADTAAPNYLISLLGGASVLASISQANFAPGNDGWIDAQLTFSSNTWDPSKALGIRLERTGGGQVNFDNVRLSYVPEPASLALLGLALAGLGFSRRKKA